MATQIRSYSLSIGSSKKLTEIRQYRGFPLQIYPNLVCWLISRRILLFHGHFYLQKVCIANAPTKRMQSNIIDATIAK